MDSILFCSSGRRVKLLEDFKQTIQDSVRIVVADNSIYAPTRYVADIAYSVPSIYDENYIQSIVKICEKENVKAILTLIDPEIEILAENKKIFEEMGIVVLVPSIETAKICFDKYEMYKYLKAHNIKTAMTYSDFENFLIAYNDGKINFPVFVKPRTGSGSVGARKINDLDELKDAFNKDNSLIAQEYIDGIDLDVDVYIDTISKKPVSMFSKKKIETKIGGASKTISFKDEKLFKLVKDILKKFHFEGTVDMDFFFKDGEYYLSEINPRFGGAYIHAYAAGIDFPKLILNNINGIENIESNYNYEDNIVMLMYDDIIIQKII